MLAYQSRQGQQCAPGAIIGHNVLRLPCSVPGATRTTLPIGSPWTQAV
jgi:hypothetical protein